MMAMKMMTTRAMMMYAEEWDGQPAPNLAALNAYTGGPPGITSCPSRQPRKPGRVDYLYVPQPLMEMERPQETILLCDLKGNHEDGRNVAFGDGHVTWMSEDDFQALLARPHNAAFADGLKKAEGP